MPVSREYHNVKVADIQVDRPNRQRRTLTGIEDLAASIKRANGLYHPIVVTRDLVLVAGERRLMAHQLLGWAEIQAHFHDELSPEELKIVELEENIKRVAMDWKDRCLAYVAIHEMYKARAAQEETSWSVSMTAEQIGYDENTIYRILSVGRLLRDGDVKIMNATTLDQACNIIERENTRRAGNELNTLLASLAGHEPAGVMPQPGVGEGVETEDGANTDRLRLSDTSVAPPSPKAPTFAPLEDALQQADFIQWADNYRGRPFNLLHCDFPYGLNHGESDQGGAAKWDAYNDSEQVYWSLLQSLAKNLDRILFPSAHVIFWFSMKFYSETKEFLRRNTDLEVQDFPLIWFKTDGKGIVPDVNRQPRRVYETAFFCSRGDRRILSPIHNAHGAPTGKAASIHISEKPLPVLRHFFRLCVDEYTELLDPTAGSGTAIRAAESMGAKRAVGLELNSEYVDAARIQLQSQRNLARLSALAGPPKGIVTIPLTADNVGQLHNTIAEAVGETQEVLSETE